MGQKLKNEELRKNLGALLEKGRMVGCGLVKKTINTINYGKELQESTI
jgi:hypothetical protein